MLHKELIDKVIALLSANNPNILEQYRSSTIAEEVSANGFYARFTPNVSPTARIKEVVSLPDVIGKDPTGAVVVGFVLFIKDGSITCLEGYTMGETRWPKSDALISLETA